MAASLGRDTGYDSIGDYPQVDALARYLDRLEQEHALPQTILYNNNPVDNYTMATMVGNFQDGSVAGKMQFGSGWWYLDQKDGIEWQIDALSNVGLLANFVGMLTDSRSFMSYPRHEYFRRVLCNMLGREMDRGELPADERVVGSMVKDICFENARKYLRLAFVASFKGQVLVPCNLLLDGSQLPLSPRLRASCGFLAHVRDGWLVDRRALVAPRTADVGQHAGDLCVGQRGAERGHQADRSFLAVEQYANRDTRRSQREVRSDQRGGEFFAALAVFLVAGHAEVGEDRLALVEAPSAPRA